MNLKKYQLLISGLVLALATAANAQPTFLPNSSIGFQEYIDAGSFTSSSLTMSPTNFVVPFSQQGTFLSTVPSGTIVYVGNPPNLTLTDLSSTPQTEDITDFLIIGAPGPFGSPGTTPVNRFFFNLQTLAEVDPVNGSFLGTGVLVDSTGAYVNTPLQFALNFTEVDDVSSYTFTLSTVPEPSTISLVAAGLLGLGSWSLRRRKS